MLSSSHQGLCRAHCLSSNEDVATCVMLLPRKAHLGLSGQGFTEAWSHRQPLHSVY